MRGIRRFTQSVRCRLPVQNCRIERSHPLPPFAEQPEMGSEIACSIRAIRMGLMRAGAIEQRENHG
jgi:hypothetical protein